MTAYFEEVIVFLLVALTAVAQSAVVRVPTIENPCRVDPTSTGTPVYVSFREQLAWTLTAANTADTMCQQFIDALVQPPNNVLTSDETKALDSPLYAIPGLPLGVIEEAVTASNNMSSFKQDYQEISTYIVYFQFFKTLQISVDSGKFSSEIENVKQWFYSYLCSVNTILRSQNNPVAEYVNSSQVSDDFKKVRKFATSGDSKDRYSLYYVAMKRAHDFIMNKNMKWATFLDTELKNSKI